MIDHLVVKLMLLSLSCQKYFDNSVLPDLPNLPDECVSTKLRVAVNHVCSVI